MDEAVQQAPRLIITADDWGYSTRYNAGIEKAVRAEAVDAVSVMVTRPACDPVPLLECGVEMGLHLELAEDTAPRELMDLPRRQADAFERLFGVSPSYIDGHRHCHAQLPLATAVEDLAMELRVPLRAVGEDHRFRLEERGIACPHRVVGRMEEDQPALPRVLADALEGEALPWGSTEWIVHPGHCDPAAGSSYDRGREEDLALVLQLSRDRTLLAARATHGTAFARAVAG
jgi:predicted glycoside hydrolase/deacetylase ChbG (UPF0249 family)